MTLSRAVRLAGLLWIAAFVGLFGTYLLVTLDGLRPLVQVLYGVPLVAWALVSLRGPRDPLDVVVLLAVAAHLVVAVAGADPTGSVAATGIALGMAVLFWLMRSEIADTDVRSGFSLAVVLPVIGSLIATAVAWILEKAAWVGAGGGWPPLESYQVFVWGTANTYPVLVLLAAPFVTFIRPGRLRRFLALTLLAAAIVVVPLSVGRAGWLGLAAAAIGYESLSGWPRARAAVTVARASRRLLLSASAVVGGLLVAVVLAGGRVAEAIAANFETRERIWSQAIAVFGSDPLTGSGPGTFSWMRLQHVSAYEDPVGVILAHNAWLQTLADGGILLSAMFGACAVLWLAFVWRGRADLSAAQRLAAAAVVGLAAASLLDDFSYLPAVMAMAVTLAAWSVPRQASSGDSSAPLLLAGAGAVFALVLVPVFSMEQARLVAAEAREDAVAGRWEDAADGLADAIASHPTNPLLHLGRGLALAELGHASDARIAYDEARALSPGDPRPTGAVAALTEDPQGAALLLERASETSTDAQYAVRLSRIRAEMGDTAGAAEAYAIAVMLRTDLYAALQTEMPGLSRDDVRVALGNVTSRVRAADPNRARVVEWDMDLADGTLGSDAPPAWRAVAAASSDGVDEARPLLEQARAEAPHAQITQLAAAAVARFGCDRPAYDRAMVLAGRVRGGPVPSLAIGRDPIYRDFGLGDYQPSWVERPPAPPVWPFGLVTAPDCEWTP